MGYVKNNTYETEVQYDYLRIEHLKKQNFEVFWQIKEYASKSQKQHFPLCDLCILARGGYIENLKI